MYVLSNGMILFYIILSSSINMKVDRHKSSLEHRTAKSLGGNVISKQMTFLIGGYSFRSFHLDSS